MFKLLIPLIVSILLNVDLVSAEPQNKHHSLQIATIQIDTPQYELYEVTAYTLREQETNKGPDHPEYGITASGAKAKENHTIACPQSMPFGTEIYIPFFDQVFVCEDRDGAITEGKLDVYMADLADALEFGRRELKVRILERR